MDLHTRTVTRRLETVADELTRLAHDVEAMTTLAWRSRAADACRDRLRTRADALTLLAREVRSAAGSVLDVGVLADRRADELARRATEAERQVRALSQKVVEGSAGPMPVPMPLPPWRWGDRG